MWDVIVAGLAEDRVELVDRRIVLGLPKPFQSSSCMEQGPDRQPEATLDAAACLVHPSSARDDG
ncbi:MAG: hypothetical protein U1A24_03070 [Cypionkella sp.]|uniref:hypothetical protein n=1 Tax=Cypionkella sp. TaxID=2811411 RepID=UPI002AB8404E|nr:hypothetical protein [Cypionkella sp.]MDZ4309528.1 hypothetical protein [Cypionkella sp.]